jgi:hypothetical protein
MGTLARELLRVGRQTALGLWALRLIGQVTLPRRIERGQVTGQKSDGRHQRGQMRLRQCTLEALARKRKLSALTVHGDPL